MQHSAITPDFFCDVRPEPERAVVRVGGELDLGAAPRVAAAVAELLDDGFARIVVDLSELSFLDSAGARTLMSVQDRAEQRSCVLSLVRGPRHVHRVFELTATDSLFAFDEPGVTA
jgi:anti-anti-sigma factor